MEDRGADSLLVIAVPIVALAALATADLLLGGGAHLTRSVLRAGGFDQLADVAERRLRLSAQSFGRYAGRRCSGSPRSRSSRGSRSGAGSSTGFERRRAAWAGLVGAAAATVAGTLANDSGA